MAVFSEGCQHWKFIWTRKRCWHRQMGFHQLGNQPGKRSDYDALPSLHVGESAEALTGVNDNSHGGHPEIDVLLFQRNLRLVVRSICTLASCALLVYCFVFASFEEGWTLLCGPGSSTKVRLLK